MTNPTPETLQRLHESIGDPTSRRALTELVSLLPALIEMAEELEELRAMVEAQEEAEAPIITWLQAQVAALKEKLAEVTEENERLRAEAEEIKDAFQPFDVDVIRQSMRDIASGKVWTLDELEARAKETDQ